jgi:hypothetical protein
MSVISISALGGGLNFAGSPYTPPAASTRSSTQLASGATVTTTRDSHGDVLAVTTAVLTAQYAAGSQYAGAQPDTSTFYVTA